MHTYMSCMASAGAAHHEYVQQMLVVRASRTWYEKKCSHVDSNTIPEGAINFFTVFDRAPKYIYDDDVSRSNERRK